MLTTKQQINMIQKVELTVCAGVHVSGKQKIRDDTLNHDLTHLWSRIKTNATNRLDNVFVLGLNVPDNNSVSVMLGRRHNSLRNCQYSGESRYLAHGHNTVPPMEIEHRASRLIVRCSITTSPRPHVKYKETMTSKQETELAIN